MTNEINTTDEWITSETDAGKCAIIKHISTGGYFSDNKGVYRNVTDAVPFNQAVFGILTSNEYVIRNPTTDSSKKAGE